MMFGTFLPSLEAFYKMHLYLVIDLLSLKIKPKQKTVIAVNGQCLAEVQLSRVNLVSVQRTRLSGIGVSGMLGMTSAGGPRSR